MTTYCNQYVILQSIHRSCPHLSHLNLSSCDNLTEVALPTIADHYGALTSLDFAHMSVSKSMLWEFLKIRFKRFKMIYEINPILNI